MNTKEMHTHEQYDKTKWKFPRWCSYAETELSQSYGKRTVRPTKMKKK